MHGIYQWTAMSQGVVKDLSNVYFFLLHQQNELVPVNKFQFIFVIYLRFI
jgi:hypothetical protein